VCADRRARQRRPAYHHPAHHDHHRHPQAARDQDDEVNRLLTLWWRLLKVLRHPVRLQNMRNATMSALKRTWSDYRAGIRRLFIGMEILGWAILAVALTVDIHHKWPQWAFVPNATNSLSGFLIGVPIALVLFTTLTNERENSQLDRLSCAAWNDFADRVRAFCSDSRIKALEDAELKLGELWRTVRQEILDAIGQDATKAIVHLPRDAAWDEFQNRMKQWCQQLTTQYGSIRIPRAGTLEMEWLAIRRSWTVLDVSVKAQRFQADNRGWLVGDIDINLQHKLDRGGNPLTGFSDIHDRQGPDKENPPMGNVPHWICKYSRGSRTEFAQQVAGATRLSPPYTLNSDTYINSAVQARMFLEDLKKCIDDAEEDDGWPGACREP
jgi:hypothetical protein